MRTWLVTVSADIPYPWEKTFSIDKSSPDAAASEAIKKYRKVLRETKGKAKKLSEIRLKIVRGHSLGGTPQGSVD